MDNKSFRKKTREESQTKISDEIISPYFIYFDGISYTLVKEKDNGNEENIGYYTNLSGALKATAKNLVNDQKTITISDFLLKYDNIMDKISEKFEI